MDCKTVIITAGTSQLGLEMVKYFANNNWKVCATTRSTTEKESMKISHPNVTYYQMDLEDNESISAVINKIVSDQNTIDLLINNAGFVLSGPFENFSDEQIMRQMNVNFFGTIFTIKKLLPKFKQQGGGTIINISSLCGVITFPMLSIYHASKWALEGFTESLLYEIEPFGIKIKLIEPGGIKENNYSTNIEFAAEVGEEYKQMLNNVHHSNWFPSFTEPFEFARQVFEIAIENNNILRHRIGADCELLINERMAGLLDESYITKIKNRVIPNS